MHWRADAKVNKVTPVVALGEARARIGGAVLLWLIALSVLFDALLSIFPWYSAIAVFTIIPVLLALQQATGDLKGYVKLMAANLNANLLAALLVLVALLVRGFAHI